MLSLQQATLFGTILELLMTASASGATIDTSGMVLDGYIDPSAGHQASISVLSSNVLQCGIRATLVTGMTIAAYNRTSKLCDIYTTVPPSSILTGQTESVVWDLSAVAWNPNPECYAKTHCGSARQMCANAGGATLCANVHAPLQLIPN